MKLVCRIETGIPCVYEIVNTSNGKRYIGSTTRYRHRFREHRRMLDAGNHHSIHLQRAYEKHGRIVFVMRPLEIVCSRENLVRREQHWIDRTKKHDCYNQSMIAERGGRDPMLVYAINPTDGKKVAFASAIKASIELFGVDTVAPLIRKAARMLRKSNGLYWTTDRSETLESLKTKKSAAKKARKTEFKVFCFDVHGNHVGSYFSQTDAAVSNGVHTSHINQAIRSGKHRTAANLFWSNKKEPKFITSKKIKKVEQKQDGIVIATWDSLKHASQSIEGVSIKGISNTANGRQKSHGGYEWAFAKT